MSNFISRPLAFAVFLLAGIATVATADYNISKPVNRADNDAVTMGNNLPGGQARMGDIDTHIIIKGYGDTCTKEGWTLLYQYENVAEYLNEHPDAQPDYKGKLTDTTECKGNQFKEALPENAKDAAYYSGITGTMRKPTYVSGDNHSNAYSTNTNFDITTYNPNLSPTL